MSKDHIYPLDPSPAGQYTRELADRITRRLRLAGSDAGSYAKLLITTALQQAQRDIIEGRFVPLQHIGEFVAVENRGPMIRYQADRRLIESCCIQNLKHQQN